MAMDTWRMTAEDWSRHDAQFGKLSPSGAPIGGDAAKDFFLQVIV